MTISFVISRVNQILFCSQVLPNMAFIPEIKATHYRVCGSVHAVNPIHAQKVSSSKFGVLYVVTSFALFTISSLLRIE